ncbi:MAG: GIY-YIG nuclease family protein [bacterium]|nr:GIY-YIG nuclease family protein [bacterium]
MNLKDIVVLVIDCQATGASPEKGSLLELGWARVSSSGKNTPKARIRSYLLQLNDEEKIPRRVKRITGISEKDLSGADKPEEIWERLLKTAKGIIRQNKMESCPVVIHFARYEKKFLEDLHRTYSQDTKFPFKLICTYEITRRLLPELPRKGLRAVAGFLGYSVDEMRRSGFHVPATIFIWREMVKLLRKDHSVKTLDDLVYWIEKTKPKTSSGRAFPMEREIRLNLPSAPGVYRMCISSGDIVYIGKATNLKQRVNSYWQKRSFQDEKTIEMLTQVRSLKVTQTMTSLEAALLESDEIKLKSPPYNIALREKRRDVWFFSRDLGKSSNRYESGYPVGPVISEDLLIPFHSLTVLLDPEQSIKYNKEVRKRILGISHDYAPQMIMFKHGVKHFREKHEEILRTHPPGSAIRIIANRLSRERFLGSDLLEKLDDRSDSETEQTDGMPKPRWTPEKISRIIENNLVYGLEAIRKARWYSLISESSISWNMRAGSGAERRVIVLEKGQVLTRETIKARDDIPVPPGSGKHSGEKQQNFDLITYDRMRVLTTELRRLLSDGRNVGIRLSNSGIIEKEKLDHVLSMI